MDPSRNLIELNDIALTGWADRLSLSSMVNPAVTDEFPVTWAEWSSGGVDASQAVTALQSSYTSTLVGAAGARHRLLLEVAQAGTLTVRTCVSTQATSIKFWPGTASMMAAGSFDVFAVATRLPDAGAPVYCDPAGVGNAVSSYCCSNPTRAVYRVDVPAGPYLVEVGYESMGGCSTDRLELQVQWEQGLTCSSSSLDNNPFFGQPAEVQAQYGPVLALTNADVFGNTTALLGYTDGGTRAAANGGIEYVLSVSEPVATTTTKKIAITLYNSGSDELSIKYPTAADLPAWAQLSVGADQSGEVGWDTATALAVPAAGGFAGRVPGTVTIKLELVGAQGAPGTQRSQFRLQLRGYPCEASYVRSRSYIRMELEMDVFTAPLSVIAVPQAILGELLAGESEVVGVDVYNVKTKWVTYFAGGCPTTGSDIYERMNRADASVGSIPDWLQISTGTSTTPDAVKDFHTGVNTGLMSNAEQDAAEIFLTEWSTVIAGDPCTNMMPNGADAGEVTLTLTAPTRVGIYTHSLNIYAGIYPGGASSDYNGCPPAAETCSISVSPAERLLGEPYLTRNDINSWTVDIEIIVTAAAVDLDATVMLFRRLPGTDVGDEVIVRRTGETYDERACVSEVDSDGRYVVDFQDSRGKLTVGRSEVSAATPPMALRDSESCNSRTIRAGQDRR